MGADLFNFGDLLELPGVIQPGGPSSIPFAVVPAGAALRQAKDQARRYGLDLTDPTTGQSLAGSWSNDDAPSTRAIVWAGGSGPTLRSPTTSWADASAAQLYLDVLPADLAPLECQPYPIRVEVMTPAGWLGAWTGTLRPDPAPASTPAPPVYTDFAELEAIAGDALDQLRGRSEGAGLLRSRAEAREWLDGVILARYRPLGWGSCGGMFSPSLGIVLTGESPDPWLQGRLAANGLKITPKVQRVAALKALSIAFGRQIGSPDLLALASWFDQRAMAEVVTLVAEIDPDAAGYPTVTVNCGRLSFRSC